MNLNNLFEAANPAQQAAIAIAKKKAGKKPKNKGLTEFAPPGGNNGDSGRWYTDDELADIIGDDWFEDFDASNDGFNIDTHGEKAKKNLVGYANSWFDDKGYNVNVLGVEHNDVDHDLKWYIVGSFQNDNFADKDVDEGLTEDFEDMPDELMDPQAWKALDIRQKYKALFDAGLIKPGRFDFVNLIKKWMNDDGTNYPLDHTFAPDGLEDGTLDLNKIYRTAQADYQGRTHSSNVTSQDRENELNIGSEGRAESKRKADELVELRREKLRTERLHDEQVAFQRAETVQQRKDEMQKIADKYKQDLTVIDKEHRNNMEAIKTNNTFELDKLDKEYKDAQRERDFKGSETDKEYADAQREREFKSGESDKEFRDRNADRDFRSGESDKEFRDRNADREFKSGESDKDYADRQRERQHQQAMADKEREQSKPEPEEEPSPRPRPQRPSSGAGNKFDQDTGEPVKPNKPQQSNQWHTNQQLSAPTKPPKPNKNDNVTDVEPKPNKPLALKEKITVVKDPGKATGIQQTGGITHGTVYAGNPITQPYRVTPGATYTPGKPLPQSLQQKLDGKSNTGRVGGASVPQKPLMAVSLDKWKEAVLKRYPEARFMTQKMINGATIASDRTGQVGIYDPKNSYAKVGPETQQGVAEGSQRVDSLVTDALKIMRGSDVSDAVQALKTVLGDREYNGRRGHYNFYVRQLMDMHGEQGVTEAGYRNYNDNRTGFGSQAYRADGGANDEDHESDRRREQQVQSGTWYIRLNGKLIKDKQGNPYSFRGKAAANKAALTMQAKLFNQGKEFMLTTNPNDNQQGVAEADMNRRRFLQGLGAAALAGASGVASADQQQDLGNGFVLTTIDVAGHKVKAVLDTERNVSFTLNRGANGSAIIRSQARFLSVKDGKIVDTSMDVGPATKDAMKKAGLLPGLDESQRSGYGRGYASYKSLK